MKTLFINIWTDKGKQFTTESELCLNKEMAIADYYENSNLLDYSHTIKLELENGLKATTELAWVKEIDITEFISKPEEESYTSEYERLTGHEMGVCAGRV